MALLRPSWYLGTELQSGPFQFGQSVLCGWTLLGIRTDPPSPLSARMLAVGTVVAGTIEVGTHSWAKMAGMVVGGTLAGPVAGDVAAEGMIPCR